jgi:hypothetical protein
MIMSPITSYDEALDFLPKAAGPAEQTFLSKLRALWEAMGEGMAAAQRYRELVGRGASPEQASAKVFAEFYGIR